MSPSSPPVTDHEEGVLIHARVGAGSTQTPHRALRRLHPDHRTPGVHTPTLPTLRHIYPHVGG